MPPRYAYWTILAGGLPTAFRAAERDDLLPTFQRIREKHPDAEMKWFARGKLWASPEDAQEDRERSRQRAASPERPRTHGERPRGDRNRTAGAGDARGRDWRPGGEHRDPRQKYKDAKQQKNRERRDERFARTHGGSGTRPRPFQSRGRGEGWTPPEKPHGDTLRPKPGARGDRPLRDAPHGDWRDRPPGATPKTRPHGDKLQPHGNRGSHRERPQGDPDRNRRPFERKEFARGGGHHPQRARWRAQGTEEPAPPPRPRGPHREPPPSEEPSPQAPPRPSEPEIPPPGPPERGRPNQKPKDRRHR